MLPQPQVLNLDLNHSGLMLSSPSHWGNCYLGELRSLYGHALLVLTKWSKFKIEVVQQQKTI